MFALLKGRDVYTKTQFVTETQKTKSILLISTFEIINKIIIWVWEKPALEQRGWWLLSSYILNWAFSFSFSFHFNFYISSDVLERVTKLSSGSSHLHFCREQVISSRGNQGLCTKPALLDLIRGTTWESKLKKGKWMLINKVTILLSMWIF